MVLREIIDSELKSIATVGSIIMVNTDNGFFDCYAEHADQNRLLDTDIYLSTVSYLCSDDELLIKCDENTSYMCDTLSSVNKKNYGKCENIQDPRSHMRVGCKVRDREPSRVRLKRVLKSLKMRKLRPKCKRFIRNQYQFHLFYFELLLTIKNGISHLLRNKTASLAIILGKL